MRMKIDFDQYEAEALAHLAEHYDRTGKHLSIDQFYKHEELGREKIMETIGRFGRYELVKMISRGTIEIYPQVIDVVAQLTGESGLDDDTSNVTYNIHGNNSRVNVNSVDNSTNTVAIDNSVFADLTTTIESEIEQSDRELLIKLVEQMRSTAGTPSFMKRYQDFVSAAANHITVLAPFLPALTKMLG